MRVKKQMKKVVLGLVLILIVLFVVSCSTEVEDADKTGETIKEKWLFTECSERLKAWNHHILKYDGSKPQISF